jgi:DNA-binding MarR family transcriptional regulator
MATTPTTPALELERPQLPSGVLLARLGQESVARFRRSLKPLGLSAQRYIVLKQLEVIGAASQASLADALGLDYSNLATVTAELNDDHLIERYRHESDRRRYVVELSKTGAALVAKADLAIAESEDEMLGTLGDEDRERFWLLLREVADAASLCPSDAQAEVEACAAAEESADS